MKPIFAVLPACTFAQLVSCHLILIAPFWLGKALPFNSHPVVPFYDRIHEGGLCNISFMSSSSYHGYFVVQI